MNPERIALWSEPSVICQLLHCKQGDPCIQTVHVVPTFADIEYRRSEIGDQITSFANLKPDSLPYSLKYKGIR